MMQRKTTDLDQGLKRPPRAPDRLRIMRQERERIQAEGGMIDSQLWLKVEGRIVMRTHYSVLDDE